MLINKSIKTANFQVIETWVVDCPYCYETLDAPFNESNPMQPKEICCGNCSEKFILTYARE
jgi:hypothetical protein